MYYTLQCNYYLSFVNTSSPRSLSETVEDDYENPMEFIDQKKLRKAYFSPQHREISYYKNDDPFRSFRHREECDIHRYSATASHNALGRSARKRYQEKSRLSRKKQEKERARRRLEEETKGCRKIETYFTPLKTQVKKRQCYEGSQ